MSALKKFFGIKKNDTYRKHRKVPKGSKSYLLLQQKRATLNAGDFTDSIKCPSDTSIEDWYAANVVDFYNELTVVVGPVMENCTEKTCAQMSAGPKYLYLWADNKDYKTPTKVPAHQYVDLLFNYIDELLDNPQIFPSDPEIPFPKDFKNIVKTIFKRLFRVYAHIYYHHLDDVKKLNIEPHFNTAFRHFYSFIHEFKLVPKEELSPLRQVINQFSSEDDK